MRNFGGSETIQIGQFTGQYDCRIAIEATRCCAVLIGTEYFCAELGGDDFFVFRVLAIDNWNCGFGWDVMRYSDCAIEIGDIIVLFGLLTSTATRCLGTCS